MAPIARFLTLLDRTDVLELFFRSGERAAVRIGDRLHPIVQRPLRTADISALVAETPLDPLLTATEGSRVRRVTVEGRALVAHITSTGAVIELRLSKATDEDALRVPLASLVPPAAPSQSADTSQPYVKPIGETASTFHPKASPAHFETHIIPSSDTGFHTLQQETTSRTLEGYLAIARDHGASDLHLSSTLPPRVRRLLELEPIGEALTHEQIEELLRPLLTPQRQQQMSEKGYVDFSLDFADGGRTRVNLCRHRLGLKACFRLIPSTPQTLDELGLPSDLGKVQNYHQGLIVISGPNGHGKTTTLASLVDLFNTTRPAHIITVEDPVEFLHPVKRAVISQREVGPHTESFRTALKGALREDPDVIAIGELRDRETVEMALTASETGHLVLSTMSTPNGASTIERLIDMFAPEDQSQVRATLAGALKLVISQRLVPTLDKTRRVVAAELITGNVPLWTLIRDNKLFQLPSLLQRGRAYGMIRVEDSLNELLAAGIIDETTARTYADEPKNIGLPSKGSPGESSATMRDSLHLNPFRKKS